MAAWLVSLASAASGAEPAGNGLPERARLGTQEVVLNGAGLNKRLFFKVYVAGLYLPRKSQSSSEVLALAGPKRISITLMRDFPTGQLVAALRDGIRVNSRPQERAGLNDRIEELTASLLAVREARKGDVITFDWLPELGTRVSLNDEPQGEAIPGEDVYRAVLRVWLGERPASDGLKKALLGRSN